MTPMDPVASLVDDFNLGPHELERRGPLAQNSRGGWEPDSGSPATFTLEPFVWHTVTGRDLLQVPEADRNTEIVQLYTNLRSWPAGQKKGFRVADDDQQADVVTINERRFRIVKTQDFAVQGRVWCALAALEEEQNKP